MHESSGQEQRQNLIDAGQHDDQGGKHAVLLLSVPMGQEEAARLYSSSLYREVVAAAGTTPSSVHAFALILFTTPSQPAPTGVHVYSWRSILALSSCVRGVELWQEVGPLMGKVCCGDHKSTGKYNASPENLIWI